ncbi:MAG TPA: zf-HC2 domain-containing protein [Terriglobales bacterium]|nr:zf-HC2 domain-containing protein [Terriglobales bacterium]
MKCSDVERVLSEFVDGASDGTFPTDIDAHVKSCPDCSDLASDLKLIASEARQLAATEEPAPRVWVRIAAELRAEGLVSDSATREPAPTRPVIVPVAVPVSLRRRWSALWLAPVTAAVLAAGAYVISHKPAPQVAKQQTPPPPVTSPAPVVPAIQAAPAPAAPQQVAKKSAKPEGGNVNGTGNGNGNGIGPAVEAAVEPEPSAEDQQFLSVVSTLGPSTRATYENQLKAVNADIRETQAYVNRNPQDLDARQHLMDAYQQKALLYQIALDRIQ